MMLVGLDVSSRRTLSTLLSNLAKEASPRVLIALREQDHVPSFITHVLRLNHNNEILHNGPKPDEEAGDASQAMPTNNVLSEIRSRNIRSSEYPIVVDLKDVNISYWGKPVLKNINWTIRQGDHWLLLGPNGSGKTTLLSLLTGDNPKSFSQDITLFGRQRGSGESIFDIQAKIGHVSPELHYHFPAHRSAKDAILSGFTGTFAPPDQPLSSEQVRQYEALVGYFKSILPGDLERIRFREMSTSHQRLVLLLRAFVKQPELLILDEPYQGMDDEMIKIARKYLATQISDNQALVMVTHFIEEEAAGDRWTRAIKLSAEGTIEEIV
jgi:molybdate transport system ATP-binding protein